MSNSPRERARETLRCEDQAVKMLARTTLNKRFDQAIALLSERQGRIIVSGIGKSGFIGMKIAATFTSLGHQAAYLHPVEAIHGDLGFVSPGDVVIAISFSGESLEIMKLVKYLRKDFDVKVIAITKNKNSSLGKLSDVVVEIPVKDEGSPHGIAPMASTTATLVMGDMFASALTSPKIFKKDHFARFHPGGGLTLSLRKVKEFMTKGVNVPLIKETATIIDALKKMSDKFLGVTGIVNKKGQLSGVITDGDIRRHLVSDKFDPSMMVSELMTRNPKSVSKEATLKEALELMENHRITSLFVNNGKKKVEGIIHIHDIVEGNVV